MALSKDGYIARLDGDSDWVSKIDEELFVERVRKAGCVVIGKTTFNQYRGLIYPISGALNIVLTTEANSHIETGVIFALNPTDALKIAEKQGIDQVIIAGGAKTAEAFLKDGLLDEIYFTIHPLVLGDGIKPFQNISFEDYFEFKDTRDGGEGLAETHYIRKS